MASFLSQMVIAQYCTPTHSSSGNYTSTLSTTNGLENFSYTGNFVSYQDLSNSHIVEIYEENNFSLSHTYSNTGQGFLSWFNNRVKVWVDWNNNGTFDNTEVEYNTSNNSQTKTFSITPPAGTEPGTYRARVRSTNGSTGVLGLWASTPEDPTACDNQNNGSAIDFTIRIISPITISGQVIYDANGVSDDLIEGTGTNLGNDLWAVLTQENGEVIHTVPVAIDGTYEFVNVPKDIGLRVLLSENNVSGTFNSSVLPGTHKIVGAKTTGNPTAYHEGYVPLSALTNSISDVLIAVEQAPMKPTDFDIELTYQPLEVAEFMFNVSGGSSDFNILSTGLPKFAGEDADDGVYSNGTSNNNPPKGIIITGLTNGTLIGGTVGQLIESADIASLVIQLTGEGYTSVSFNYQYVDQAGAVSEPALYSFGWDAPLPIELTRFTAIKEGSVTKLEWTTAQEKNNKGFAVQRSADGKSWTNLEFVNSQGDYGYSSELLTYTTLDRTPLSGHNFYRLMQEDYDGQTSISNIELLVFDVNAEEIMIYPNPTQTDINVSGLNKNDVISVYDNIGRLVREVKVENTTTSISLASLASGIYNIVVKDENGQTQSFKVIKQ